MWYKCLNQNCGFVFPTTEKCDKCPNCSKQCLQEVTNEEIESIATDNINENSIECKPSLDERIKNVDKRRNTQTIPTNFSKKDDGNQIDKDYPNHIPTQEEPEL